MGRRQRMTALLLCFLMLVPTRALSVWAEAGTGQGAGEQVLQESVAQETVAQEMSAQEDEERIREVLPLEPMEELAVYWNPGGSLPEGILATGSDAQPATASNVTDGNDRADGLTPSHPVKTLETALKQVDRLAEEYGADQSDITIYAMNPMEIPDGKMYVLNAGNIQITSWPGRAYQQDTVFYLNGGQLTLMNVVLESGDGQDDPEEAELVRVRGGSLQLGQGAVIDGRIVMDYRQKQDAPEWTVATGSDAVATSSDAAAARSYTVATGSSWTAGAGGSRFDMNDYIFDTDEDAWELLEDRSHGSTWQPPVIELIEGFDGADQSCILEIRSDRDQEMVTVAKTLYADDETEEGFGNLFCLAGQDDWNLIPMSKKTATVRDTGAEDLSQYYRSVRPLAIDEDAPETPSELTVKTLSASRAAVGGDSIRYWNPGGAITYGDKTYSAGSDENRDGTKPEAAFKTLDKAVSSANGGTVIAMQTLELKSGAEEYLGGAYMPDDQGTWMIKGSEANPVTLKMWDVTNQKIWKVPEGETLSLGHITLKGPTKNDQEAEGQAIEVDGGDLIIGSGVTAQTGCIQIDASDIMKDHPVQADSTDGVAVKLFFSGINRNLNYRFTDVVVPTETLLPGGDGAEEPEKVKAGELLMDCYSVSASNSEGDYKWALRPDEYYDDFKTNPHKLELYTVFFYHAVYLDGTGERGKDNAMGDSCENPVLTWKRAKEVWEKEMAASMKARKEAYEANPAITRAEMDKLYSYPDAIYICGTVTVDDASEWEQLPDYVDYDNTVIKTEVRSHRAEHLAGAVAPIHAYPENLVKVISGGSLKINGIMFRNDTDLSDSATILVDGGALELIGAASMTGELKADPQAETPVEAKSTTKGAHIRAINGAKVTIDNRDGYIECRQQGVAADGVGTEVTMKAGTIRKNDIAGEDKKGAGVSLTGGAHFSMEGGEISGNKAYRYGGGVALEGKGTQFDMKGGLISSNTAANSFTDTSIAYGMGIYAGDGTKVNIGDGSAENIEVKENYGRIVYGAGIYSSGDVTIKKAAIRENKAGVRKNVNESAGSRGIGIHIAEKGSLTMDGAEVSGNYIARSVLEGKGYEDGLGAGIYLSSNDKASKNTIRNSVITENIIGASGGSSVNQGGGIYVTGANTELNITDTNIIKNRAAGGAGIYSKDNTIVIDGCKINENIATRAAWGTEIPSLSDITGYGGGIYAKGNGGTVKIKNSEIKSNLGRVGGGICSEITTFSGEGMVVSENLATLNSGGVHMLGQGYSPSVFFRNVYITDNEAEGDAGGLYLHNNLYAEDMVIERNTAGKNGGGIYHNAYKLHLSESSDGKSSLTDNVAGENGGGIYINGQMEMNIAGEMKNTAKVQGNNIYQINGGSIYLHNGILTQPETSAGMESLVYNVYFSGNQKGGILKINPQKVEISGQKAIYLDTTESLLYYYNVPPSNKPGAVHIDVNKDVFRVGSIIVKPANETKVLLYKPNAELTGTVTTSMNYSCTDASANKDFVAAGSLPRRTQLGAFQDPEDSTLTNLVLLGEGVYLAGPASGGSDEDNDGSSPQQAVATFGKAKEILVERIKAASQSDAAEKQGYSPYIYICGTVPVAGSQNWELDYMDPLFKETNADFEKSEREYDPDVSEEELKAQVRRFASFLTEPMIDVGNSERKGNLTLDHIIIDGMGTAVMTSVQGELSPVVRISDGSELTVKGMGQIRNNYHSGVFVQNGGSLTLTGLEGEENKQIKDIDGRGVWLDYGSNIRMEGSSRIYLEDIEVDSRSERYAIATKSVSDWYDEDKESITNITMTENSAITAGNERRFSGGIYIKRFSGQVNVLLEKQSGIWKTGTGISLTTSDMTLSLKDQATLSNNGSGLDIWLEAAPRRNNVDVSMNDNVSISNNGSGIALSNVYGDCKITMNNNSKISRNITGIEHKSSGNKTGENVDIVMNDDSRISANQDAVILQGDKMSLETQMSFTMNGNSVIGGNTVFQDINLEDDDCGNSNEAVIIEGPVLFEMNDKAAIRYNRSGISWDVTGSSTYKFESGGSFTMKDDSKIEYNTGSAIMSTVDDEWSNKEEREGVVYTLQDRAEIISDSDVFRLNKVSSLYLLGNSKVYGTEAGTAIDAYGKVYMEGSTVVRGRMYLRNHSNPIYLLTAIPDERIFHLHLPETFMGKAVVVPEEKQKDLDAGLYLNNFVKDIGEGLAQDKPLAAVSPNIILAGENNVYLSGLGDDANSGNSPGEAVRTFHRARELLKTGYYTAGANVIICGEVELTTWGDKEPDDDWSFDEGGRLTNVTTHQSWEPLVQRYKDYRQRMIVVPGGYRLKLRNITIDGNREKVTGKHDRNSGCEVLKIETSAVTYLEQGAVLQNNRADRNNASSSEFNPYYTAGVNITGGRLIVEGGIIRGMYVECYNWYNEGPENSVASAVHCADGGVIELITGQICDNVVTSIRYPEENEGYGAAVVISDGGSFVMTGGTISGNKNDISYKYYEYESVTGAGLLITGGLAKIKGGVISGNQGGRGSGIFYYESGEKSEDKGIFLSGGEVKDNSYLRAPKDPSELPDSCSPIYVGGSGFRLEGGGCDISDAIYLDHTDNHILVSGAIDLDCTGYKVRMNQGGEEGQYHKGSIVVAPDGSKVSDVAGYLPYFSIVTNPYVLDRGSLAIAIGSGSVREGQCLLLMRAVFIDGDAGEDANDGNTPLTPVKTFKKAQELGEGGAGNDTVSEVKDYYIIYVCGKVSNTEGESVWNMGKPAYMCRYTGFPIDNAKRTEAVSRPVYYGHLVEPAGKLEIKDFAIYGRRSMDSPADCNGESLFRIPAKSMVSVSGDAVFGRNRNIGQYLDAEGTSQSLQSTGGAFLVEPEGTLKLDAGQIADVEAAYGSAIYLGAGETAGSGTGRLCLNGNPKIGGSVYLSGTGTATAAYVEAELGYMPPEGEKLALTIGNDYNGRPCVAYPKTSAPGERLEYYTFEDSVYGLYDVVYGTEKPNVIELRQRMVIYLDGSNGDNEADGQTPDSAFRTLRKVYETIAKRQEEENTSAGTVVYIVGAVPIDSGQKIALTNKSTRDAATKLTKYTGSYSDSEQGTVNIEGQVSFKRYAQPQYYDAGKEEYKGYTSPTWKGELFSIKGDGELSLNGIYLDGHSQDLISSHAAYSAKGVTAEAPLVVVDDTGKLICDYTLPVGDNVSTSNLFVNNINNGIKTKTIGELNGSEIREGSSAGIELLGGESICSLNHVEFRNLVLGENAGAGGTDVYHNGAELHFQTLTLFSGTVFLEGLGTVTDKASQTTSRYLTVDAYGTPASRYFEIQMRDPYLHRTVVSYPLNGDSQMIDTDIGGYHLEGQVKEFFCLAKRSGEEHILELIAPPAVYIDGQAGSDDKDGSVPARPVRTMGRAYALLKQRAASTIYVVDTVAVDQDMSLTGTGFNSEKTQIDLISTEKVNVVRYIRPDQGNTLEGYNVPDFKGSLFRVEAGSRLTIGENVIFDGHSEAKAGDMYPDEVTVSHTSISEGPLVEVDDGGIVEVKAGSVFRNNNNNYAETTPLSTGANGGVFCNRGTITVSGAVLNNNHAEKGDAVYQAGTFTVQGDMEGLTDHSFYLASSNDGTEEDPVWNDRVLQFAERIPDAQQFAVDMDHAVKGRDVIRFTSPEAYAPDPGADAQHVHFALGQTVPEELFLVEDREDSSVLELQDWEYLKVDVPADIYLVVRQGNGSPADIQAVRNDTAIFGTPEYTITNHSKRQVTVSINGIEDRSQEAGIPDAGIILKETRDDTVNATDLYLAVETGSGSLAKEISLLQSGAEPKELFELDPGREETFRFKGAAGNGFADKYKDMAFPMTDTAEEIQNYMDGAGGTAHARAGYLLKYKIQMTGQ